MAARRRRAEAPEPLAVSHGHGELAAGSRGDAASERLSESEAAR